MKMTQHVIKQEQQTASCWCIVLATRLCLGSPLARREQPKIMCRMDSPVRWHARHKCQPYRPSQYTFVPCPVRHAGGDARPGAELRRATVARSRRTPYLKHPYSLQYAPLYRLFNKLLNALCLDSPVLQLASVKHIVIVGVGDHNYV